MNSELFEALASPADGQTSGVTERSTGQLPDWPKRAYCYRMGARSSWNRVSFRKRFVFGVSESLSTRSGFQLL
jgi:hypothetical protein